VKGARLFTVGTLPRSFAALAVVVGGLSAVFSSGATLPLFRDTLHYNCSWGAGGALADSGEWVCGDGLGYFGVAVGLGGMSALLLLVGLVVAAGGPSRRRAVTLIVFASGSVAWISWCGFHSATVYTGARPAGETGLGSWAEVLVPGLSLCAIGLVVGAAGVAVGRRWSLVAVTVGACLMILGTTLQLGVGVSTLAAAGLLLAAGIQRFASVSAEQSSSLDAVVAAPPLRR
jgi:hypothetical protein